jgi:protease-4
MLRALWSGLLRLLAFLPLLLVRAWRRLRLRGHGVVRLALGADRSEQGASLGASRALIEAIEEMAEDDAVRAVVVDLRGARGGWASLQELRRVIARLRASGKLVMTHLDTLELRDLYLASAADRVWMTPTGVALVSPVGARLQFFGDALAAFGVKVEVVAAGDYKSFGERFSRSYASAPNREALTTVLTDLEALLVEDIAAARGVEQAVVRRVLSAGPMEPEELVELGLIDGVAYPDEARERLRELMGERRRPTSFGAYFVWRRLERWLADLGAVRDDVAVVHLEGAIVHGAEAQGGAGSRIDADRVVPVLDGLRKRGDVRAVVLYVDSPGGSALASDLIARSVGRLAAKKPVVAAFHNVSASGGYYLSAPASEIVAREGTITGSIGVIGGKVVVGPALARLGVHGETVSPTPGAGFLAPWRGFDRCERERYQGMLQRTYDRFLAVVSGGRKRPVAAIHEVAQGRIWTGRQALEHGLVDHLGGLDVAVERAQRLAGLEPHRGRLRHVRFPPPRLSVLRALIRRRVATAGIVELVFERLGRAGTIARLLHAQPGVPLALLPWDIDGVQE